MKIDFKLFMFKSSDWPERKIISMILAAHNKQTNKKLLKKKLLKQISRQVELDQAKICFILIRRKKWHLR